MDIFSQESAAAKVHEMAKLFIFVNIGGLGGFWFRIALGAATTTTETNRNVDAKMLKVTADLEGCPESPFFTRCFKEK